MKFNSTNL